MSKESVKKIDIARIAEKRSVAKLEKARHKEYSYQRAVDEKRRKASARAVAKAADNRRQQAKRVKEAFVKKGETQANVMLMARRRSARVRDAWTRQRSSRTRSQ